MYMSAGRSDVCLATCQTMPAQLRALHAMPRLQRSFMPPPAGGMGCQNSPLHLSQHPVHPTQHVSSLPALQCLLFLMQERWIQGLLAFHLTLLILVVALRRLPGFHFAVFMGISECLSCCWAAGLLLVFIHFLCCAACWLPLCCRYGLQ